MTDSVRNYVYIDEPSLNSYLSSLGNGVLEEITEESGNEKETEGGGSVGFPSVGLGISGRHNRLNTETVSTTMRVLAPYRVQRLEQTMKDKGISTFDGEGGAAPSRRDIVNLTSEVSAMSLFRLESALAAITGIFGGETGEVLARMSGRNAPQEFSPDDFETLEDLHNVSNQLIGDKIPVRMDISGYPFVILLKREIMDSVPEEEFLEDREYTVIGRVEKKIEPQEEWDPIAASRILDNYMPQEQAGETLRNALREIGESRDMDIQMDQKDLKVEGPGSIVHPIAMYW